MTSNGSEGFRNALRLAVRRSVPGQVTIPDLVVQMKLAGFSQATEESIRQTLTRFRDKEICDKLNHLFPTDEGIG